MKNTAVTIPTDPLKSATKTEAESVIDLNPSFWGCFVLSVYIRFVHRLIRDKDDEFFNCRNDEDWRNLSIDVPSWINILDTAMRKTLERIHHEAPSNEQQRSTFVHNMFSSVSRLFILPIRYGEALGCEEDASEYTVMERLQLFEEADFAMRIRTRYARCQVCSEEQMIFLLDRFHTEITYNQRVWTFWDLFETQ